MSIAGGILLAQERLRLADLTAELERLAAQ
jgi:hypothetical protein